MARVIKKLKSETKEDIEIIIIPQGLADNGTKYTRLHRLMTKDFEMSNQTRNFSSNGGFAFLKNLSDDLKIVITKKIEIKEMDEIEEIEGNELFKETYGKSVEDLKKEFLNRQV